MIVFQSVMWACWACFAYAILVHEPRPLSSKLWIFMGVITFGVVLGTLLGGKHVSPFSQDKTFWGLIDLIKWMRGRRTRIRGESGGCIHCGYPIGNGPEGLCPECGQRPR